MDMHLLLEVTCDRNKGHDKQGTNILLTRFLGVVSAAGLLQTELSAEPRRVCGLIAEQTALNEWIPHPSNACLGREASAGNPPYVFLY